MEALRVLNLEEARFECTFGRGCAGICCRNGRPPIYADDEARIAGHPDRFLALMRPEARELLLKEGFLTHRRKDRQFTLRVIAGWCIFFHEGCVLEKAGLEEGDRLRYKPLQCALFPLEQNGRGDWFVRQKGYGREDWDLPCLDPGCGAPPAAETLREELALAQRSEQVLGGDLENTP